VPLTWVLTGWSYIPVDTFEPSKATETLLYRQIGAKKEKLKISKPERL
jgi:hypothetical protein